VSVLYLTFYRFPQFHFSQPDLWDIKAPMIRLFFAGLWAKKLPLPKISHRATLDLNIYLGKGQLI
jgi:hypothetical protein